MIRKPLDGFDTYFTEKLWEIIPAIYRHEDGLLENPGVLRALISIIAEQAATLRRSHDRLWEDQYIDFCDDWVVPYIADLLGTRLVSALNSRARRVDTAKTIYYRRRKGTVRILEELISDITGWEGKVVEQFHRLSRSRHGLDPYPLSLQGAFTQTLPGGLANIRSPRTVELTGSPFDEFTYTPDVRRHAGSIGRYNIPKIAFHLYRILAFRMKGSIPFSQNDGKGFTFDPSGRDIPLFSPRNRPDNWDDWETPGEWRLPAPVKCNALGHLLKTDLGNKILPNVLKIYIENNIGDWEKIARDKMVAADLENWTINAPGKDVAIDAEKGRLLFINQSPTKVKVNYCFGFSTDVGAGPYARHYMELETPDNDISGGGTISSAAIPADGILQINDSFTYGPARNKSNIKNLKIIAANFQRPYIRINSNWTLNTGTNENSKLVLDGIWIGAEAVHKIILKGNYEQVVIKQCTLDPGGQVKLDENANNIIPVSLEIRGHVELLQIEKSIIGPIQVVNTGFLRKVSAHESIFQATNYNLFDAEFKQVTVFGTLKAHTLHATDTLFTDEVNITNIQDGCFRFSSAPPTSRLPRQYESYQLPKTDHYFTSQRLGNPGYAQLSETAPRELHCGGENGAEIGVFNSLINPIKYDSLNTKVEEYLPFGLIPIYIKEN